MTTAKNKPFSKTSQILPSNYHLSERSYYGCVQIGGDNFYTPYFDDIEEAKLELRCLEKQLGFEVIDTFEQEGYYPNRAILIEELYQQSGRTNGLYTGLNKENGAVSEHNSN